MYLADEIRDTAEFPNGEGRFEITRGRYQVFGDPLPLPDPQTENTITRSAGMHGSTWGSGVPWGRMGGAYAGLHIGSSSRGTRGINGFGRDFGGGSSSASSTNATTTPGTPLSTSSQVFIKKTIPYVELGLINVE